MYNNILEEMERNSKEIPGYVLLGDGTTQGMTYGRFYRLSGKVYSFLKEKGIGREDMVLINLPRGIQHIIAMAGVWRAGAAFVIVEDTYAPERIDFIRKDCGCKFEINEEVWKEIQKRKPLMGYEPMVDHAAAFAVYTSGSTGNPKGVLHEYGNIDRIYRNSARMAERTDRFAIVCPLNFVAALGIIIYSLMFGVFITVVPYSIVKDPMKFGMFLINQRITGTFLAPSLIRRMEKKPPSLSFCLIGSEPADNVYLEGLKIYNSYSMSEAGFALATMFIDKPYDICPVGISEGREKIYLLDENGNEVGFGEEGEICVNNPFVRGYINLPEQTEKVFINGVYHTGDLGRFDEEGRLIICGRLNDMVKINGNRVEPGEIEAVTKKVLGIEWAAARIFDDGQKVFICVYYLDNIEVNFEETRRKMEKYLPYYMLPSFFIHIDNIPLKETGKMDRKALPKPCFEDYADDYVAPTNEIEKALCEAFRKVLDLNRIGINDDFYQLGGDSLASMAVIQESKIKGLLATDIFRGHTPKKIAEIYNSHIVEGDSPEELNDSSMTMEHGITVEQNYMFDYQLYTPFSTMYNIFCMFKLDKKVIDMQRFTEAVNETVINHAALLTEFYFDESGDVCQKYNRDGFEEIQLERVTENELEEIKKSLVTYYKLIHSKLSRFRVFETEEAGYFFMDVHHLIFDGTSSKIFMQNLLLAYSGRELGKDYYYYSLLTREKQMDSDYFRECKDYFDNRYGNVDWCKCLTKDESTFENKNEEIYVNLPVTHQNLDIFSDKYGLSRNGFFITATAIANAIYENKKDIMVSWIYNGRNDEYEMSTVGLLFRNLPVGLRFENETTLKSIFDEVNDQLTEGISHSCYPYVEIDNRVVLDDYICVLYQDNLRSVEAFPGLLAEVELDNPDASSQNAMDLEILNTEDGIVMMIDYTSSHYHVESIERYRKIYTSTIEALVNNLCNPIISFGNLLEEIDTKLKMI